MSGRKHHHKLARQHRGLETILVDISHLSLYTPDHTATDGIQEPDSISNLDHILTVC